MAEHNWTCRICDARIPTIGGVSTRRKDARTVVVSVSDTLLADAYAHVWAEHSDTGGW